MRNNKIIYSLNIKDIQGVAMETLERKLSANEVEKIIKGIEEKIHWHDAISESINEYLSEKAL